MALPAGRRRGAGFGRGGGGRRRGNAGGHAARTPGARPDLTGSGPAGPAPPAVRVAAGPDPRGVQPPRYTGGTGLPPLPAPSMTVRLAGATVKSITVPPPRPPIDRKSTRLNSSH